MVANRREGSLASALSTAASTRRGTSGRLRLTGGGAVLMCCIATATKLSPVNGTSPVRSSKSTMPSE